MEKNTKSIYIYQGNFVDNKIEGYGKYYYENGDIYEVIVLSLGFIYK